MKNPPDRPSATTLPSSPHDDASRRSRRYLVMMAIRILCFILMIVITPYGWYTWAFAAGAVFLPYIAVVVANNGDPSRDTVREAPEKAITASAPETPVARPTVIRVSETRPLDDPKAPHS
ncbi:DUF3099 domain-containing protein [Microbacterium koreense]|uniref:DUF3099 domain-containing protein n=1 Tax=Microbacterium koreense TaxID=323761 RepID=A0ABW2ZSX3_9MICO